MCGIAGYIGLLPGGAGTAALERMARQLERRGPDRERIEVHGSVGLIHRQLLASDRPEPADPQPPGRSPDRRYRLIHDGELYNAAELRAELDCPQASDAELLLACWQRWGAAGFDRCNGTFALALLDTHTGELVLARDPYGVKQLYLATDGSDRVAFGSDICTVLAAALVPRRPDPVAVYRYLAAGCLDDTERTFFDRISRLLPGEQVVITADGTLRREAYTRLYQELDERAAGRRPYDGAAQQQVTAELATATERRLASSTPATSVSRRELSDVCPTPGLPDLVEFVRCQQEPVATPGSYAQFCVMREAGAHATMLLDGQAAGAPPANGHPTWTLGQWWGRCRQFAGRLRRRSGPAVPELLDPEFRATHAAEPVPAADDHDRLGAAELFQRRLAAPLRYADRNTGQFAVIGRVPLLDLSLLRLLWSLDVPATFQDGADRRAELLWFGQLAEVAEEVFASESFAARPYVAASAVLAAFRAYRSGGADGEPVGFWRLFNLELWLRESIDRDPVRPPASTFRAYHRLTPGSGVDPALGVDHEPRVMIGADRGAQPHDQAGAPGAPGSEAPRTGAGSATS